MRPRLPVRDIATASCDPPEYPSGTTRHAKTHFPSDFAWCGTDTDLMRGVCEVVASQEPAPRTGDALENEEGMVGTGGGAVFIDRRILDEDDESE